MFAYSKSKKGTIILMKIGAIGTSFIMDTILENMVVTEGISCEAIFSRTYEKGKVLADKFNIDKIYTSLDDMLKDDALDWIYVCSPNSVHYEQSKKALLAGKHVLCEKPFTTTSQELKELISIAKEKHLFLFEAILPMFHPNYKLIKENLPFLQGKEAVFLPCLRRLSLSLSPGSTPKAFLLCG